MTLIVAQGGGSKGREQESDKKRGMGGFKKLFGGGSSKGSVKGSATS